MTVACLVRGTEKVDEFRSGLEAGFTLSVVGILDNKKANLSVGFMLSFIGLPTRYGGSWTLPSNLVLRLANTPFDLDLLQF